MADFRAGLEQLLKEAKQNKKIRGTFHDDPRLDGPMGDFFMKRIEWQLKLLENQELKLKGRKEKKFDLSEEYEKYYQANLVKLLRLN